MLDGTFNFFQNCVCRCFCMPHGPIRKPARYWIFTIPQADFTPFLPPGFKYLKGQLESGETTGYQHWQLMGILSRPQRLSWIKSVLGDSAHAEPTKSAAAEDYVWKDDTSISGTRFELGQKPFNRNNSKDWEQVWDLAKTGRIDEIPYDIRFIHYKTIKNIQKDYLLPVASEKQVIVYWGRSGAGKSRRAWDEAGFSAYPKDPNTKFWDGYQSQENVVIDEFRGKIDISHMLRWLDRYPVIVECKFGAVSLCAKKLWVTSNKDPRQWYPEIDQETQNALLRRLNITYFP